LRLDGFQLREQNGKYILESISASTPLVEAVSAHAAALDYDSVQHDAQKAVEKAETDPDSALTAPYPMLETTCPSILAEMKHPLPAKKDAPQLAAEIQRHLNLSPARTDIGPDIKQILSGLTSIATGIGALRTHAGDAHGRARGTPKIDGRIARLAIHAA